MAALTHLQDGIQARRTCAGFAVCGRRVGWLHLTRKREAVTCPACRAKSREVIPDAWLGGYLQANPGATVDHAVDHWLEQARLARTV